jgi:hypothetical protein
MALKISELKQRALLVRVEVGGISLFRTAASFDEYGIDAGAAREVYSRHTAGVRQMIDPAVIKKLRSLETSLRNTVNNWAFEVPGFLPYRLATYEAMAHIETAYEGYLEKWNAVVDEIERNHEDYRDQWATYMGSVAASAWGKWENSRLAGQIGQEGYVRQVQMRALMMFPSVEKIRERLRMELIVGPVRTQLDYEQELLEMDRVRAERSALLAREETDLQVERVRRDEQVRIARERIRSEITEPLEGLMMELKGRLCERLFPIAEDIGSAKFVHHNVVKMFKNLSEYAVAMGMEGDDEIVGKIKNIASSLESHAPGEPPREHVIVAIQQLTERIWSDVEGEITRVERAMADPQTLAVEL